ncbi:MAG: transporter [Deltaproteobacteria bacterium]|nr:transporter [Candidatus Anaeroferrophillus wilburensis]MBN2889991.1 transporter [Deltaproteobacteria bacterium]
MKRRYLLQGMVLSLVICGLLGLTASQSGAGGSAAYPNGAEAFMVGMVPPPGGYFVNYVNYYHASQLMDDDGDDQPVFDEITVKADVLRFIWISKSTFLGGTYGQHLFIPFLDVDLDFTAPVGPKHKTSYSDRGVPYLIYSPLLLGYHLLEGKLHVAVSLADIYIPTGQDDGNLAGVGRNYWTFEPVVAATWLYNQWELSAKFMVDISSRQDDCPTAYGFEVDRKPGQEFHCDYSLSYGFSPQWRLGVSGYYYRQLTDDDYDPDSGVPSEVQALLADDEENHSEVFAVGPGIWYNYQNMFFSLRSQWEMGARNKSEGSSHWFKFTYVF